MLEREQPALSAMGENLVRSREFSGLLVKEVLYSSHPGKPTHSHANSVFWIVLRGGCTEVYAKRTREYGQYHSEFLPFGHIHSLRFHSPLTRCLSIEIANQWSEKAKDYGLLLGTALHSRGGPLVDLFMKVHRELCTADRASGLAIQGLVAEMLAHVSRRRLSTSQRPKWLDRVQEFLHAHFSEEFRMYDVADEVGVHPAHLSRQFRKSFGQTMGEYVRELRIRQAMLALTQSTASLANIGVTAGFADQSHFCRVFRTRVGISPGEFRKIFAISHVVRNSSSHLLPTSTKSNSLREFLW
jgi:AraC family transcriptional regulator